MLVTKRRLIVLSVVVGFAFFIPWILLFKNSHRPFDADALATSETRMWKAYYNLDLLGLHAELNVMLRNQFGLSRYNTWQVSSNLAAASMSFASSGGSLAQEKRSFILAHLTKAYRAIGTAKRLHFEPADAANAELAWWVARRTPGENMPEQVGARIEDLYRILYGKTNSWIAEAAQLRAQAAHVRDTSSDWPEVERLLVESYSALLQGTES